MRFLEALFDGTPLLYGAAFVVTSVVLFVLVNLAGTLLGRRVKVVHRLAVLETARIDRRRNVVLIRRDGTEYLVLTGGHHDLVLDTHTDAPAASFASAKPAPIEDTERQTPIALDEMVSEAAAQLTRLDRRLPPRAVVASRPTTSPAIRTAQSTVAHRSWRLPRERDI